MSNMNKNQWSPSAGGVSKSMFGVNLISNAFGNPVGSQPSLRVKLDGRNGLMAGGGRSGTSSTVRDVINELPDRPTVGRKIITRNEKDGASTIRNAEYIASFPVTGESQVDKSEYIKGHLKEIKFSSKTRPVRIIVSLAGIKICDRTGETVYMAHALKRISYATCHPDECQFSFLAREPKAQTGVQYCHAFSTNTSEQAEELNAIVANAFKLAFDGERQSSDATEVGGGAEDYTERASFHDVIRGQIEAQKEQFEADSKRKEEDLSHRLSIISTPHIDKMVQERKERRQRELSELELRLESVSDVGESTPPATTFGAANAVSKPRPQPTTSGPTSSSASPYKREGSPSTNANNNSRSSSNTSRVSPSTLVHDNANTRSSSITEQSNEQILTAILATLNSDEANAHGSPVTRFKEAIDKYFKNSGHHASSTLSGGGISPIRSSAAAGGMERFDAPAASNNRSQPVKKAFENISSRLGNWQSGGQSASSNGQSRVTPAAIISDQKPTPTRQALRAELLSETGSRSSWSPPSIPVRNQQSPDNVSSRPVQGKAGANGYDVQSSAAASIASKVIAGEDDRNLKHAAWYQPGLQREIALDILSHKDNGHFMVRDSTTHPGCYALSIKVSHNDNVNGITHFLIMKTARESFKIKGLSKEWSSLTALVTHHTVMKELLPCPLIMPGTPELSLSGDELKNY